MWHWDKDNPLVLFHDIREVAPEKLSNGQIFSVRPDKLGDYRALDFPDETFSLIVFDPPHTTCGDKSFLYKRYGTLLPTWETDLRAGFAELFRVLKPGGTLVFKWCDIRIPFEKVLACSPLPPVITHTTRAQGKSWTYFAVFFKKERRKK
jgi:SAM-dependent methyltransferase